MHKFNPEHAKNLTSPQRLEHEKPEVIVKAAGAAENMVVVDVGCGTGFYSFPLAKIVGAHGLVYAVDLSKDMIALLEKDKEQRGVRNVQPVLSQETRIPLPDKVADMLINVNMLHEPVDRDAFIKELKRLMKDNGRLLIIDHKKEPGLTGPPLEDRVAYEEAVDLLKNYFDIVVKGPSGDRQYGILAMK